MRSIGRAAAAAAGLIVPLAFVLPVSADAQSLALSGGNHFVGSSDSDEANEVDGNEVDGNGAEVDGNGAEVDGNGAEVDENEVDGNGAEVDGNGAEVVDGSNSSEPVVTVYGSGLTTSGDVALIVRVSDAGAFDTVTLQSPALDTGCASNNLTGATSEADRFGTVVFSAEAISCIPGKFQIAATESNTETYYGDVTIR